MTEHYVTLFDSVFLPQGLALHHSLLEHGGDCVLWVLCLDDACFQTLQRLDLPKMRLLDLAELETEELLAVKPSRTKAEYCWTLTPWSIQWALAFDQSIDRITYLDADMYFLKSPQPIFNDFESSQKAVLITDHSYAPEYDQSPVSGRFCVQFVSFCRYSGFGVLSYWRDLCLEWCFSRVEEGRFGDQKYLEAFSKRFPNLIYEHGPSSLFQAPWNASYYPFSRAIVFHFHGLRVIDKRQIFLSNRYIPKPCLDYVYKPYVMCIVQLILSHDIVLSSQMKTPSSLSRLKLSLKTFLRRRLGVRDISPGLVDVNHFLNTTPSIL